ncbi:MAG: geranylgeranylglyceryl/heptaprenylglyceryl phosphate synthase [Bacteroidota bacterium]
MPAALYHQITTLANQNQKQVAVLVDPDKVTLQDLEKIITLVHLNGVNYIFVGGSLITGGFLDECIRFFKGSTSVPVVLFPGNALQIHPLADGILLLSLISGRNPELLIGSHVVAAPALKQSGLEIMPTGYMLVESGKLTSVVYMSNTTPIPSDKPDIATSTAMAGEMLGMKLIYLDAGSGAARPVPQEMILEVKKSIGIPLIVGGGIRCTASARTAWNAGADIVVVGNALENDPEFIEQLCLERNRINQVKV